VIRRILQRLRLLMAWRSRAALPRPPAVPAQPYKIIPLGRLLLGACRETPTDELLRVWDEGHELGGVLPDLLGAVGIVLREERGIEVCPCGASPNRLHTRTCKETT
jgi:hypothetical protein